MEIYIVSEGNRKDIINHICSSVAEKHDIVEHIVEEELNKMLNANKQKNSKKMNAKIWKKFQVWFKNKRKELNEEAKEFNYRDCDWEVQGQIRLMDEIVKEIHNLHSAEKPAKKRNKVKYKLQDKGSNRHGLKRKPAEPDWMNGIFDF